MPWFRSGITTHNLSTETETDHWQDDETNSFPCGVSPVGFMDAGMYSNHGIIKILENRKQNIYYDMIIYKTMSYKVILKPD